MFSAQLEEKLQSALDARGESVDHASLVFATDFARLLARILPQDMSLKTTDRLCTRR